MGIKIYNLETSNYETEKVCAESSLRFLYGNPIGKVALEVLVARALFSRICGLWADSKSSAKSIQSFAENNGISIEESQKKFGEFATFNDFFTRALVDGARPVAEPDNKRAISFPADARHLLIKNISACDTFYTKGQKFNLEKFLSDKKLAKRFEGGDMLISRLCPLDYHRFHYPVSGVIAARRVINGALYSVSPIALSHNLEIFWQNRRVLNLFETDAFGLVAFVEIGATNVGSIVNFDNPSTNILRGFEAGLFRFGGSCVATIFEKSANIKWISELEEMSAKSIEVYAKVNTLCGK